LLKKMKGGKTRQTIKSKKGDEKGEGRWEEQYLTCRDCKKFRRKVSKKGKSRIQLQIGKTNETNTGKIGTLNWLLS